VANQDGAETQLSHSSTLFSCPIELLSAWNDGIGWRRGESTDIGKPLAFGVAGLTVFSMPSYLHP
jgi:hypothetical protein